MKMLETLSTLHCPLFYSCLRSLMQSIRVHYLVPHCLLVCLISTTEELGLARPQPDQPQRGLHATCMTLDATGAVLCAQDLQVSLQWSTSLGCPQGSPRPGQPRCVNKCTHVLCEGRDKTSVNTLLLVCRQL